LNKAFARTSLKWGFETNVYTSNAGVCYNDGMSEPKTKPNNASVSDFLNSVEGETKRQDSLKLLELFTRVTGQPARMWGTSIIGFDMYHFKSERSSQEGDWPMVGFSPRKQYLTLYVMMPGSHDLDDLIACLGKCSTSKSCLYINKLADVDMAVLEQIVAKTYAAMKEAYSA
jgi:hypothetical protein